LLTFVALFIPPLLATKKWMAMHDLAKAYKSTHDNLDVPPTDTENAVLFKWSEILT
jgi:hypothetical protein